MILVLGCNQSEGNDTHCLLRIVGAVSEALNRCGNDLHGTEALVHGMRAAFGKNPFQNYHNNITNNKCNDRGKHKSLDNRLEPVPIELVRTSANIHSTGKGTYQGMGRGGWNSKPPGNEIPYDRGKQRGYQHFQPIIERSRVSYTAANGLGYTSKHDRTQKIHYSRHQNCRPWLQRSRRYRRCNRVSCIMESVNEVKS
ncbi:hypothetical protein D3C81_1594570 [compost metagenome]